MGPVPDTIVLKRDLDLAGRRNEIWVRRGLFALVCAVPVLALLNLFGQRPDGSETIYRKATATLADYLEGGNPTMPSSIMVKRSEIAACLGSNSQNRSPEVFVAMVWNGPRYSKGAPGFGSNVSR